MTRPALLAFALSFIAFSAAAGEPVKALPLDACSDLRGQIEARLDAQAGFRLSIAGLEAEMSEGHGLDGMRCWLWARIGAWGVPEAGLAGVAGRLATAFGALGWSETDKTRPFAADGPDGTVFARARGKQTCVVAIQAQDLRKTAGAEPPQTTDLAYRFDISCFRPRWDYR